MAKDISSERLRTGGWMLYLFILPSVLLIATFAYFPAANAMYRAFFRWNGSNIEEFTGLRNFRELLGWSPWTPLLWLLVLVWVALLVMTLGGWPERWKRRSPWLLAVLAGGAWAVFAGAAVMGADADARILNLPVQAAARWLATPVLCTFAGVLLRRFFAGRLAGVASAALLIFGFLSFFYHVMRATGDRILWSGFAVTFIFVTANIVKMVPSIATAVVIHRLKNSRWQYFYRVLFVIPMIIPGMVMLLLWKFFYDPTQGILNRLLNSTGIMALLQKLDGVFHWGVFSATSHPAWLGDANLVIPSLIFWGFPWVGVVGVLIYLAGLSSISTDVYEAADIDGVNWFTKFLHIELPLIMSQVRINLVLMVIGTLQDYGNILVILGNGGGPQGVAMVPGLYMFRNAFVEGYAGKGCAIGIILFFFILILTEINNRFVRVEK